MAREFVRPLWVVPFNFLGDRLRRMIGAGPRWKMHLRLARALVDRGSWFMIPLTSGTQSPIFDAIDYVAEHDEPKSAIRQLERLFECYASGYGNAKLKHSQIGNVTYVYGPKDYIPLDVQWYVAKVLLTLYVTHDDATQFVEMCLDPQRLHHLGHVTMRVLLAESIRRSLSVKSESMRNAFELLMGQYKSTDDKLYHL